MLIQHKVRWLGQELTVNVEQYRKPNNVAIQLLDAEAMPFSVATLNPDVKLPAGVVCIKDYSENLGVMAALIEAGVIGKPTGSISVGYAVGHICPLLVKD